MKPRGYLLAVAWAALAWVMLLLGLGSFGLIGPDEPRYAAIAAGMPARHDWITPKLWGQGWFEKPVLYYWLAALSDAASGVTDAASRRPNAWLALLLCLCLGLFLGRVHSRRAGWLAGFLSLTCAFLFVFGRAASTDMTLTAPLALAMMALYLWWRGNRQGWLAAAAVLLGLATLAKGPVAVALAGLLWIAVCLSRRRPREIWAPLRPVAIGLFLLTAAPWYIAVQVRNPSFARVFFLQHNLERFATNRFQHPQPFWFYLPVLLLALFPWTGWLGLPISNYVRRWRLVGWRRVWSGDSSPLQCYLSWWLVVPLVFFSLSDSKLPGYILPAIPGGVGLIAVAAAESWERLPRWALAISALLTALTLPVLALAPWLLAPRSLRAPAGRILIEPAVWIPGAAAAFLLLLLVFRRRPAALVAATVAVLAAAVITLTRPPLNQTLDTFLSARPLAQQLREHCSTGLPERCGSAPLYAWNLNRNLLYGVEFYLGGAVAEADSPAALTQNSVVLLDRTSLPALERTEGRAVILRPDSVLEPWRIALILPAARP